MVSLVNSHTNAISKMWHLWEIDLRFVLNSTPGWRKPSTRNKNAAPFKSKLESDHSLL